MGLFLRQETLVALLLCYRLGQRDEDLRPLSARQYATVAKWLGARGLRTPDLLQENVRKQLADPGLGEIGAERVGQLLDREACLALVLERWTSHGIWVVSEEDAEYPARYRTRLQNNAPPIVFGVGNQAILQSGGMAIVGSRHAPSEAIAFTQRVGAECAKQGIPVISGGAKGIDSAAMISALQSGGNVIGVLAEGLGKIGVHATNHDAIRDGRLTLISPYEPGASWYPFTAMERNKLIYALSDGALIVASADGEGGTWAGAVEALKRSQIPIYVKTGNEVPAGNRRLLQSGAREFPQEPWSGLRRLFEKPPLVTPLFESVSERSEDTYPSEEEQLVTNEGADAVASSAPVDGIIIGTVDSEDDYIRNLEALLGILAEPLEGKSVAQKLSVRRKVAQTWLKRAVKEGRVLKTKNPVRYVRATTMPLFGWETEAVH
jgi:predicted Rossmann fold nucleotide-binding protein DprA/Smf involved in DNA uptake